jgi:hypothetical protein
MINRLVAYSALGIMMCMPAWASSLTFTNVVDNSSSLCGGICAFGSTFGWVGVNDSNEVATSFVVSSTLYYGYTFSGGTYSAPTQVGTNATSFVGVNDAGIISGFNVSGGSAFAGFTDNGGTFSSPYKFPSATSFNNGTPDPFTSGTIASTFVNGLQALDGTSSEFVGFFSTTGLSGQTKGFVYNPSMTSTEPFSPLECTASATTTNPYSINDSGEVAGYCKTSSGAVQQAFIYNSTTPNTAPTILSSSALASALGDTVQAVFLTSIDDSGDLAGYYSGGANNQSNGFYCRGDYTFSSCTILDVPQVAAFDSTNTINGTEILGMNNIGSVVGIYTETSGATYAFLATTAATTVAPEPGTLILTGASILGLVAFRLRRKTLRA